MTKIICAAVKMITAIHHTKVWRGHRHNHALAAMRDELSYELNRKQLGELHRCIKHGFMTSENLFVDRETAAKIAFEAGQIKNPKKELYSEDLY